MNVLINTHNVMSGKKIYILSGFFMLFHRKIFNLQMLRLPADFADKIHETI